MKQALKLALLFLSFTFICLSAWVFFTAPGATVTFNRNLHKLETRPYEVKFCPADVSGGLLALLDTVADWRIHSREPRDPESVCFPWNAAVVAGAIVSMLFSFLFTRSARTHNRLNRMLRFNFAALGFCALTSLTLAVYISLEYWNYGIWPPALNPKVTEAVRVAAFSEFNVSGDIVSGRSLNHIDEELPFIGRAYRSFVSRKLLDGETSRFEGERLRSILTAIQSSGELFESTTGYSSSSRFNGYALELRAPNGDHFYFVEALGGQVSNDHYPFYEFTVHGNAPDTPPTITHRNRFYFDVAGLEGMTALGLALVFTITGNTAFALLLTLQLILKAVPRAVSRRSFLLLVPGSS